MRNGTLYDYLEFSINIIIDIFYSKYKYLFNLYELSTCVRICFMIFGSQYSRKANEIGFDVFHPKTDWSFKIFISQDELDRLDLKMGGTKQSLFLTRLSGLDTWDLTHDTTVSIGLPKLAYTYTIDHFHGKIPDEYKDEYVRYGGFKIGLA